MNPFFSIIIPVYNTEKYLQLCLESLLNQTFKNFEILLINDGSTDSSVDICNSYRSLYPSTIKVTHKQNEGQLLSRINGLHQARGSYILFVDSDDMIRSDSLEILYTIIQETSCDLVLFNCSRSEKFLEPMYHYKFQNNSLIDKETIYKTALEWTSLNSLCTKCIHINLFDLTKDISHLSTIRHGEDTLQSMEVIDQAQSTYYTSEILYYYRLNTESISFIYPKDRFESFKKQSFVLINFSEKWLQADNRVYTRILRHGYALFVSLLRSKLSLKEKIYQFHLLCSDSFFDSIAKKASIGLLPFKAKIVIRSIITIHSLFYRKFFRV